MYKPKGLLKFFNDSVAIENYNKFACNFLVEASKETEEANYFVSPVSFEMLLSLLANGVDKNASQEILNYLSIPSLKTLNELNGGWRELCNSIEESNKLSFANSIWIGKDIKVKKKYEEMMSKDYNLSFFNLPTDPLKAKEEINKWCSDKTEGMIPEFLKEPLSSDTKFTLYNASYFAGLWSIPFYEEYNILSEFHTPAGIEEVKKMQSSNLEYYYKTEKYHAIEKDYEDNILSMRIILPYEGYTVDDIISSLPKDNVRPKLCRIKLSLPKFEIKTRIGNLKSILQNKGVTRVFNDPKCFSNLTKSSLSLKNLDLAQETKIEVTEKGTRAAAVTGGDKAYESGFYDENYEIINFNVDRPFIFSIIDRGSKAILFIGVVTNPNK